MWYCFRSLKMATFMKDEPGFEDEGAIMSRITIKNEPGTSVVPGNKVTAKTELEHNVGIAFEIEHPVINQTFTEVKDEITIKDESIQEEKFRYVCS